MSNHLGFNKSFQAGFCLVLKARESIQLPPELAVRMEEDPQDKQSSLKRKLLQGDLALGCGQQSVSDYLMELELGKFLLKATWNKEGTHMCSYTQCIFPFEVWTFSILRPRCVPGLSPPLENAMYSFEHITFFLLLPLPQFL